MSLSPLIIEKAIKERSKEIKTEKEAEKIKINNFTGSNGKNVNIRNWKKITISKVVLTFGAPILFSPILGT